MIWGNKLVSPTPGVLQQVVGAMCSKELDDPGQKPSSFGGEHCMKRLDSSCWVVTAAGVAAAVVFVFVVYQSHKHLGLSDPSFESPRL